MIIIINSHIFGEDTSLAYSIKLSEILKIKNMNSEQNKNGLQNVVVYSLHTIFMHT